MLNWAFSVLGGHSSSSMVKKRDWNQVPCLDPIITPIPAIWAPNYDLLKTWHEAQMCWGTRMECPCWNQFTCQTVQQSWIPGCDPAGMCDNSTLIPSSPPLALLGAAGKVPASAWVPCHGHPAAPQPHSPSAVQRGSSCLWLNYGVWEQGKSRNTDLKVFIASARKHETKPQRWTLYSVHGNWCLKVL